jgi:hypothetical protein
VKRNCPDCGCFLGFDAYFNYWRCNRCQGTFSIETMLRRDTDSPNNKDQEKSHGV